MLGAAGVNLTSVWVLVLGIVGYTTGYKSMNIRASWCNLNEC